MKKIVVLLLALCMIFMLCACGEEAVQEVVSDSAEAEAVTTVEDGVLHMATNAAFPPYEMVKDGGGYEGIDVEIATAIADELGLELVVDDMDFSSVITSVQSGKADICMAGLTVTDERKEAVDFTEDFRREDKQQHDNFQRAGQFNLQLAGQDARQDQKDQRQCAKEHALKVKAHRMAHQRQNHQAAQGQVYAQRASFGIVRDLLPELILWVFLSHVFSSGI